MTLDALIAAYVFAMLFATYAWLRHRVSFAMLLLAAIVLTFSAVTFEVTQRSQQQQSVRNDRECADVSSAAEALNSFGQGVRDFIRAAERLSAPEAKKLKKGTPQYRQYRRALAIYDDLRRSIKTVHVTECRLVTNRRR